MNIGVKEGYQQYRRYFVNLPRIPYTAKARSFIWLSITIFTISFFLIVAVKPTLVTIAKLNKEIKDKTVAANELQKKINAIIAAQDIYTRNADNLVLLDDAFPEKSEFPRLAYFFEQVATASGITFKTLNFERVGGTVAAPTTSLLSNLPLNFSLSANGDYLKLKDFLKELESSRRLLKIKEATFSRVKKGDSFELMLYVSGQASFGKKSLNY